MFTIVSPVKAQLQPERVITLPGNSKIESYAISDDGTRLAVGYFDFNTKDSMIVVLNAFTGEQLTTFSGHNASIADVDLSPNNNLAVSGDANGVIKLWDATTGDEIATMLTYSDNEPLQLGIPYVEAVAFSPDGNLFVTADSSSVGDDIQIWDTHTQEIILGFEGISHVLDLQFSPNGRYLIAVSSSVSLLFDIETGERLKKLSGAGGTISQDGEYVYILTDASASGDDILQKWNIQTGELIETSPSFFLRAKNLSISKDGKLIAATSERDQQTILVDVQNGEVVQTFKNDGNKVFQRPIFRPDQNGVLGFAGNRLFEWDISNLTSSIPSAQQMGNQ